LPGHSPHDLSSWNREATVSDAGKNYPKQGIRVESKQVERLKVARSPPFTELMVWQKVATIVVQRSGRFGLPLA
jgi:hypothetical protein